MCLATVYLEEKGRKEEIMNDVAWIEFKDEGVVMTTLLGEEKLLQNRVKSIDLVNGTVLLERF